jgi:hypothetical protein
MRRESGVQVEEEKYPRFALQNRLFRHFLGSEGVFLMHILNILNYIYNLSINTNKAPLFFMFYL